MLINVPELISESLHAGRSVYIPNIGTFESKQVPALINFKENIVSAPYLEFSFKSTNIVNSIALPDLIINKYQLEEELVRQIVERFQIDFKSYLDDNKELSIDGVGLIKNGNQGFEFTQLSAFSSTISTALPDVPLHYYSENESEGDNTLANAKDSDIQIAKESWMPMILAIASCAVLIFAFWFVDYRWNLPTQTDLSANENQHIRKSRFNASPAFDSMFATEELGDSSQSSFVPDAKEQDPEELLPIIEDSTQNQPGSVDTNNLISPPLDPDEAIAEHELLLEDQEMKAESETEIDGKDDPLEKLVEENCVIVVGAFGNPANVEKMKLKLEARFGKVHLSKAGRLTRVGVYSACNKTSLRNNLNICRNEFESSSWIYISE